MLGFDNAAQTNMLEELLGALTPQKMRAVFLSALGLVGLILALYFLPNKQKGHLSPSYRILLKAIKLVETKTGVRRDNKTLSAYINQTSAYLPPHAAKSFKQLCEIFEREHYAKRVRSSDRHEVMKLQLKTLKQSLK